MPTPVAILLLTTVLVEDPLALEQVLARAGAYVQKFEQTFSSVVAEERYRQKVMIPDAAPAPPPGRLMGPRDFTTERRELKSDFLLVRSDRFPEWVPFRDVFEVNGKPVRERENRLVKLFLEQPDSAFEQATRVTDETSRYNIGPVIRTVNVPTQPLSFLDPANLRRSVFEKGGEDRIDGVHVWEVRFEEVAVPTLIRTTGNASLPAQGAFWIDPSTGAVLKGQIRTNGEDLRSEITVTFRTHDELDIRVPAELREKYRGRGYEVQGTATYGRFRRFRVTTEEVIK
jgi:hypothetical protein